MYVPPGRSICVFRMILEIKSNISLHITHRAIFYMETRTTLCGARTACSCTMYSYCGRQSVDPFFRRLNSSTVNCKTLCINTNLKKWYAYFDGRRRINKIKYVLRLTQLYVYFIIILLLATSFGLRRPSSGQYLQKKKNFRSKVLKCCANIYINRQCLKQNLTPNYTKIKIPNTSPASTFTKHKTVELRKDPIKNWQFCTKCGDWRSVWYFYFGVTWN